MFLRIKLLMSLLRGKPSQAIPLLVKAIAEGKFGEVARTWYWRLAGLKLWITAVVATVAFGLEQFASYGLCVPGGPIDFSCQGAAGSLYAFAGFLAVVGLYDGAVRSEAPFRKG